MFHDYILRVELWVAAFDKGQPLTGMSIDSLRDEMLELRSYIFPRQTGEKTKALDNLRDMMSLCGFLYSEVSAKTRKTARRGPHADRRAVYLKAYDMKERGASVANVAEQLCENNHQGEMHVASCEERFLAGMKEVKRLLQRLDDTRAERKKQLNLYALDHARRKTDELMRETHQGL